MPRLPGRNSTATNFDLPRHRIKLRRFEEAIRSILVAPFADYLFCSVELAFIYLFYLAFAAACSINSATSLG